MERPGQGHRARKFCFQDSNPGLIHSLHRHDHEICDGRNRWQQQPMIPLAGTSSHMGRTEPGPERGVWMWWKCLTHKRTNNSLRTCRRGFGLELCIPTLYLCSVAKRILHHGGKPIETIWVIEPLLWAGRGFETLDDTNMSKIRVF